MVGSGFPWVLCVCVCIERERGKEGGREGGRERERDRDKDREIERERSTPSLSVPVHCSYV